MSKTSVWAVVSALALVVAATGVVAYRSAPAPAVDTNATAAPSPLSPVWTDAKWPFPIDQWGTGRAFVCKAADCGAEVTLYLRAKLGFCNCTTGVADDEELERVGDLDLVGTGRSAVQDGRPITVHWMKGRSRAYTFTVGRSPPRSALAVAFNDRCDAISATAVVTDERALIQETAVLEFLNGTLVRKWAETALGI